jgi:putative NIF3 family GTP cyclohydrolase 1 type 2
VTVRELHDRLERWLLQGMIQEDAKVGVLVNSLTAEVAKVILDFDSKLVLLVGEPVQG